MNKFSASSCLALASLLGMFTAGCGGQEVEVTGEAKSAEAVSGEITIEFFDAADAEAESLAQITLAELGPFEQVVEIDSDEIRIFALADADKDGKCSEGEAWAEGRATVKDDGTTDPVTLELVRDACPEADAAE
jgi:hypothetical protein